MDGCKLNNHIKIVFYLIVKGKMFQEQKAERIKQKAIEANEQSGK